ncbi:hypothetical protein MA6G0728R_4935 [Mycobacteroides abscessus 6G-0728-R]|nr:hypothetical protein MA4S0726RB_4240 [Mycobacteroides abscessus 4S-0726-RB]EIU96119.1 hypothetical protein MA6G0728R_4935 [Mycobacteroides abscessus 6G-0728-R]EIV44916.1 hypothetical protein MA3A0930R_5114 [Mycobacteroides abscessus 3A-0930-R]ETZ63348.1 hypothetical protein L836_4787 [Mycobacteroides abscessus MAB_110811_2726]
MQILGVSREQVKVPDTASAHRGIPDRRATCVLYWRDARV